MGVIVGELRIGFGLSLDCESESLQRTTQNEFNISIRFTTLHPIISTVSYLTPSDQTSSVLASITAMVEEIRNIAFEDETAPEDEEGFEDKKESDD